MLKIIRIGYGALKIWRISARIMSRHYNISIIVKAKLHYAIQLASKAKQLASWFASWIA